YSGRRSELVERGLLFGIDLEDLIKPGDPENLQQIGMNAAKLELALDRGNFLLEVDQLAERGAGEILHVTEVQQDVLVTLILDQAVELLAHFLDLFFGHDLGINETDNRHSINVFPGGGDGEGLATSGNSCRGREPHRTQATHVCTGRSRTRASQAEYRKARKNPPRREPCVTTTLTRKCQGIKGPPRKDVRAKQTRGVLELTVAAQYLLRAACSSAWISKTLSSPVSLNGTSRSGWMQQSLSFPLAASTRLFRLTSLPSTVEEQYWTLPKLSRICFLVLSSTSA